MSKPRSGNKGVGKEINWCCSDCGRMASSLSGHKKLQFDISTFHAGICDVCGEKKSVTEPRDFFYPDFSLLNQPSTKAKETE